MGMTLTKAFVNNCRNIGALRDFLCQAIDQVDEKDKEIAELKAKLESEKESRYADSVDAGMRERKLKRALWLARAERALAERRRYCAMAAFENIENDALRIKWCIIQHECLKKAEEYK